jgi:DNA-binding transcriptional ArsR family regulator
MVASKLKATVDAGEVFMISDLETLKLVADPLRLDILERMRVEPRTVKQIAAELAVAPTRLYYHVKQLEDRGLLRVVDTRIVSGIIEKRYQTSAYRLSVDPSLLVPGEDGSNEAVEVRLALILGEAAAEIRRGVRSGLIDLQTEAVADGGAVLGRTWLKLTPADAQRFLERLNDLFREAAAWSREADPDELRTWEMLLGLYPTEIPPRDRNLIWAGEAVEEPAPAGDDDA